MLSKLILAITLLALLGSGLMAGLFFAYSNSVMPALARMPGPQGIAAFNHVNVVIYNPLFLSIFTGTAALAILLVVATLLGWTPRPGWILAGAALYLAGNIAVTFAINVPMNDALAAAIRTARAARRSGPRFSTAGYSGTTCGPYPALAR